MIVVFPHLRRERWVAQTKAGISPSPDKRAAQKMRNRVAPCVRRSVGSFDAGSHLVAELGATIASGAAGGPGCWFAGDGTIASNCAAGWGAVQKNGGRGATRSA